MEKLHYIMHIPKTAGLSLQGLVRRRHKKPGSLELIYTQDEVEKGFKDRPELQTVMGHYRFGFHKFSTKPFRYFTFLRNPVEHVISHYHYTKDYPEKFEFLPGNLKNVIDFAQCPYGYNLQTRFISGIDDIKGREEEALSKAKTNLKEHFAMIGLTEEFDLSLLMMGKLMNWKIFYYVRENTGKVRQKQPQPSKNELAQLEGLLEPDIELYHYARELFKQQKEEYPDVVKKLPAFQLQNRAFQKLNPTYIKLKQLFRN